MRRVKRPLEAYALSRAVTKAVFTAANSHLAGIALLCVKWEKRRALCVSSEEGTGKRSRFQRCVAKLPEDSQHRLESTRFVTGDYVRVTETLDRFQGCVSWHCFESDRVFTNIFRSCLYMMNLFSIPKQMQWKYFKKGVCRYRTRCAALDKREEKLCCQRYIVFWWGTNGFQSLNRPVGSFSSNKCLRLWDFSSIWRHHVVCEVPESFVPESVKWAAQNHGLCHLLLTELQKQRQLQRQQQWGGMW